MKRTAGFIGIFMYGIFNAMVLWSQCVPDTANCKDTGDPGQICPPELPDAGLNLLYDEVVTVIPPASYPIGDQTITIVYMVVDSVRNLPPGIDYFPNADVFFPDTAYCIQITGTPADTGVFALKIYITPFVDFLGNTIQGPQVADTTSVTLTVVDNLGMDPDQLTGFRVHQNVPNPFSERTRLSYFSPSGENVELSIYNILGVLVYHESVNPAPGEHNFRFDGRDIDPGIYLYRVTTRNRSLTGRLIKSR